MALPREETRRKPRKRRVSRASKTSKTPARQFFGETLNLPEVEEKVLKFWEESQIFEKSLAQRKGKKTFVFYEGPPGANGRPGIHHVLPRIFKDIILRFRTMQGYSVPRKSGWDTHGLPVEIAAEKELGLSSKKEIEEYGIAEFNKKCREIVWQYKSEWERYTKRIGFWLDLKNPYVTYEPDYIESLWWILKQISDKKLLQKGHKVVPWCTRCGTSLSSHELGQPGAYQTDVDAAVYVKFKLLPGQKIGVQNTYTTQKNTSILAWTTTPWTLPGNVALAVGEKISYAIVRINDAKELYILAKDLVEKVFKGEKVEVVQSDIKGKDLIGLQYEPLFAIPALQADTTYRVYPVDFVTTTDGTGVVHTAVMYGEDDYVLGKKIGLPQHHTVDEAGKFTNDVEGFAGLYVKSQETEKKIFAYLEEHGTLLKTENYTHEYPHCWRCNTPLLYYARDSWFVLMSKVQEQLVANNKKVNWIPEHIKNGRFGAWLREAKDWNFSRERYWGTPIPVWECTHCKNVEVIGSLEELSQKSIKRNEFFFARHGESTNITKKICASEDTPQFTAVLTAKGKREAKQLAQKLKSKKIDIILASPLKRMQETAGIVAAAIGVPVEYHAELSEMHMGSFDGISIKDSRTYFADLSPTEHLAKTYPSGESHNDIKRRIWQFVKKINRQYEGKNILILTHGDLLLMIKGALEGKTDEEILKMKYPVLAHVIYPVDFKNLPLDDDGNLDMHRPYIDEIEVRCSKCKSPAKRIKGVADVWYDSGAMPFAQGHYPFENKALIDKKQFFPADFISEALDQTRGWFYTLLAVSTLLGYESPYKNVICLGLVNDKFGKKMSKSKGNTVDPWMIMEKYGIDAVRWYFYTMNDPGDDKNFDEAEILKSFRKMHLILFNSFGFLALYAPKSVDAALIKKVKPKGYGILDQWILERLEETKLAMTTHLEQYHIREAALALEQLVDDLSRWYIRRSRRRLQKSEDKKDYLQASATLGFVLFEISKLIAPFTPFFGEAMYHALAVRLRGVAKSESVHLSDWSTTKSIRNKDLIKGMAQVRSVASAALAMRAKEGIKVRQPLASLSLKVPIAGKLNNELIEILKDEVNVKAVKVNTKMSDGAEFILDIVVTPELRREGMLREVIRLVQELRQKADYRPSDLITLMLQVPPGVQEALLAQEKLFKKETNAKSIAYQKSEKFDAEVSSKLDEGDVWVGARRV